MISCRCQQLRRTIKLSRASGFTLIELLVVITIVLILAVMTSSVVGLAIKGDTVRGGARQVQSYLLGARDRAIYAKEPRGVRFLLDPTNNRTVSSMIFIKQTPSWSNGYVQLERFDPDNDGTAGPATAAQPGPWPPAYLRGFDLDPVNTGLASSPTSWVDLYRQGLLVEGARIKLTISGTETWYNVSVDELLKAQQSPYYPPKLRLTTPASINQSLDASQAFVAKVDRYELYLAPSVLPDAEPVNLPKGSVIHLDRCTSAANVDANPAFRGDKLPSSWKFSSSAVQTMTGAPDPSGFGYIDQMDVMFSPRGTVTGTAAQKGIIHFYIADQKDADRDRLVYWPTSGLSAPEYGSLADKYERGDKIIVSLFTRTGAVSTHHVESNLDPFKFAETGEVAGK